MLKQKRLKIRNLVKAELHEEYESKGSFVNVQSLEERREGERIKGFQRAGGGRRIIKKRLGE